MDDDNVGQQLIDCGKVSGGYDETLVVGSLSINDILHQPFDKHIGSFEIPNALTDLLNVDEINAVITWYYKWKLTEPVITQNTCTIKKLFGFYDGVRVIIAINLYKYLRNKGYDPDVMEQFLNKQ